MCVGSISLDRGPNRWRTGVARSRNEWLPPPRLERKRMQRIDIALKIHFALLAALGGIILGFSEAAGALPLIAVFSALFSLIFIDLLGLFALPSLAAYIGMGLVAAYCISDFVPLDPTNNRQLTAVAELLVLVQAVLMLQKKSRRVF